MRLLGGFASNCWGGGRKYIVMHRYEPFLIELVVIIAGLACKEIISPHTCALVLPVNTLAGMYGLYI